MAVASDMVPTEPLVQASLELAAILTIPPLAPIRLTSPTELTLASTLTVTGVVLVTTLVVALATVPLPAPVSLDLITIRLLALTLLMPPTSSIHVLIPTGTALHFLLATVLSAEPPEFIAETTPTVDTIPIATLMAPTQLS
jgi:hypothetical protein